VELEIFVRSHVAFFLLFSWICAFTFVHLRLHLWLKILITCSLSVEMFLMFRQYWVVVWLVYIFSSLDLVYSSVAKISPMCSGHWLRSLASLRRKLAGVSCSSWYTGWYCVWAEADTSQGLIVHFRTAFTLEASLLCVLGNTDGHNKLCSL
jgi:hypothetical protein